MSETVFEINRTFWHMIDVAGQKSKRIRWTTYLEKNISSIIFVFSIVSYFQQMEECPHINRLDDAIEIYEGILVNPVIKLSSIIVFMNKYDLIKSTIKKYPPTIYYTKYKGQNDKDGYVKYVNNLFKSRATEKKLLYYQFKTTATDKTLMLKVMGSVRYMYALILETL